MSLVREIMAQEVAELSSALLTWTLEDETGAPVILTNLATLTWTLTNEATGLTINSRTGVNIKNLNGGTVHATTGACTLVLTPNDNALIDPTRSSERHIAFLKGTYNGGAGVVEKEIVYTVRSLVQVP
jgi:hypothetical protein